MAALAELERAVTELGFKALRVIRWLWQRPPDDRLYDPLYARCVELAIPFCTQVGHTGPATPSEPGRPVPYLDRVARSCPSSAAPRRPGLSSCPPARARSSSPRTPVACSPCSAMDDPGNPASDDPEVAGAPRPGSPVRGSATGRPIMAFLDVVGRRWTLRIIWELHESAPEPLTFRALQDRCEAMSSSVLNQRLRELRGARLVDRTAGGYALTPTGVALVASLQPALAWSARWARLLEEPAAASPGRSSPLGSWGLAG